MILLTGWLAWRVQPGAHGAAGLGGMVFPALGGVVYTTARTVLKVLSFAARPQGTPMDIDATIDAFIKKLVASKVPATASLQPECDAAIAAAEALAHKALEVYAVSLIAKKAPQLLSVLQQTFPNAGL